MAIKPSTALTDNKVKMDMAKLAAVASTVLSTMDLVRRTEHRKKVEDTIGDYEKLEEELLDLVQNDSQTTWNTHGCILMKS